jgi:hypothetical protein
MTSRVIKNISNMYKLQSEPIEYMFSVGGIISFITSYYLILLSHDHNYQKHDLDTTKYDDVLEFQYNSNTAYFNYTITQIEDITYNDLLENLQYPKGTSHILFPVDTSMFLTIDLNEQYINQNISSIVSTSISFPLIHSFSSIVNFEGIKFNSLIDDNIFFFDRILIPVETLWTSYNNRQYYIEGIFNILANPINKFDLKLFSDNEIAEYNEKMFKLVDDFDKMIQ